LEPRGIKNGQLFLGLASPPQRDPLTGWVPRFAEPTPLAHENWLVNPYPCCFLLCLDNIVDGKYKVRHLLPLRIRYKIISIIITIKYRKMICGMPVA
jgi:hypothetical protein